MKGFSEIFGLFLITAIVTKIIDFNSLGIFDYIILALFAVFAVLNIYSVVCDIIKKKKSFK